MARGKKIAKRKAGKCSSCGFLTNIYEDRTIVPHDIPGSKGVCPGSDLPMETAKENDDDK